MEKRYLKKDKNIAIEEIKTYLDLKTLRAENKDLYRFMMRYGLNVPPKRNILGYTDEEICNLIDSYTFKKDFRRENLILYNHILKMNKGSFLKEYMKKLVHIPKAEKSIKIRKEKISCGQRDEIYYHGIFRGYIIDDENIMCGRCDTVLSNKLFRSNSKTCRKCETEIKRLNYHNLNTNLGNLLDAFCWIRINFEDGTKMELHNNANEEQVKKIVDFGYDFIFKTV